MSRRKDFGYYDKALGRVVWVGPDGEIPHQKPPEETLRIKTDEIPPTESMATMDRQIFTSLAKLDEHYKEHGYERCHPDDRKKKPLEPFRISPEEIHEIATKAFYDHKYGRVEVDERTKETWKREDRNYQAALKRQKTRWA